MSLSNPTFEIVEIPGSGAFSAVCVARSSDEGLVALKVLRQSFVRNADVLKRTRDEARMLNRLRHRNIVRVDALLAIDRRPVVVMEYVEGMPLDSIIHARRGGVPVAIAVEVVRQLGQAVDAAYNSPVGPGGKPMHIVHRDIRPSNILLSVGGDVKLLDFGIAKGDFAGREADSLYLVHGSQGFMSPERMEGVPDTPAVDVYALGLTLFQLITGKPMVVSRQSSRHDAAVTKFLAYLRPEGLPDEHAASLREQIRRMCAYAPETRPQPREVSEALERWLWDAELEADMVSFARQDVVPLRANRTRTEPRKHPAWREVAFLHTDPDHTSETEERAAEEQATIRPTGAKMPRRDLNRLIRRTVVRDDWTRDLKELRTLTRGRDDWSMAPFFAILDRESVPWWKIWSSESSTHQLAAALQMLQGRTSRAVVDRALTFVGHPDPDVAEAARNLVSSSGHAQKGPGPLE